MSNRAACLFVTMLPFIFVWSCGANREPSQQEIVSRFESHRQEFERLRILVDQKPMILDVYDVNQPIIGEMKGGQVGRIPATTARVSEIRQLMDSTGVRYLRNHRNVLTCSLWLDSVTWGPGGASKGILYSRTRPRSLLASVDSPSAADHSREGTIFARADRNWYVWYEFGH